MKLLDVDYKMNLDLSDTVTDHYFALRCVPLSRDCQTVVSRSLIIEPSVPLYISRDVFGNTVYHGHCFAGHNVFSFHTNAIVQVHSEEGTREVCPPFYKYPTALTACTNAMKTFLYDTFYKTELNYAVQQKHISSESIPAVAQTLLAAVHKRIVYTSGATTVRTTAQEAFEGQKGVCQDYAHLFIALCRRAGICARYVCGMSKGEGATHAWAEFFVPDNAYIPADGSSATGKWYGIDPTRNKYVDDDYVILAVGRDFCDCQVDRGVFCGAVSQKQTVFVRTTELAPPQNTGTFSGHSVSGGADLAGQQ